MNITVSTNVDSEDLARAMAKNSSIDDLTAFVVDLVSWRGNPAWTHVLISELFELHALQEGK